MVEAEGPVGVGVDVTELFARPGIFFVGEDGARDGGSGVNGVDAGLVEGDGVGARENTDVGDDGRVVVRPAVAVRGDVHHEADMERGFSVKDCLGIFGDALAAHAACVSVGGMGGGELAYGHALAAADAEVMVDYGFIIDVEMHCLRSAAFYAHAAAGAFLDRDHGVRHFMQEFFPPAARRTHAEILQCAAETGQLVALEMVYRNDGVGLGDCATDHRVDALNAARDGHFHEIVSFQTVGNDEVAAGRVAGKARFHSLRGDGSMRYRGDPNRAC